MVSASTAAIRKVPHLSDLPAGEAVGALLSAIDAILEADRAAPVKQRHTAKRIFERLRDEHGYAGGLTVVKLVPRQQRLDRRPSPIRKPKSTCHRPSPANPRK